MKRMFTFPELVAVAAMALVLSSLALLALEGAAGDAKQKACQANLMQFGVMHAQYAADNGDFFTPGRTKATAGDKDTIWAFRLAQYAGDSGRLTPESKLNKLVCPAVMEGRSLASSGKPYDDNGRRCGNLLLTYGINMALSEAEWKLGVGITSWHAGVSRKRAEVESPGDTLLLAEVVSYTDYVTKMHLGKALMPVHEDSLNLLFADGHVENAALGRLPFANKGAWTVKRD